MRKIAGVLMTLLLPTAVLAADSSITTPGGQKLDTKTTTSDEGTVHRQGVAVCDEASDLCAYVDSNSGIRISVRDSSGTLLGTSTNPIRVDTTGTTSQPIVGLGSNNGAAASSAQLPVLPAVANAATPSHTEGRGVNLSTTLEGLLRVTVPESGLSADMYIAAAAANQDAQEIKSSAGVLYGVSCTNTNASARYAKIYNDNTPTSSDTPLIVLMLPGSGGHSPNIPVDGVAFSTAIGSRYTTGAANNDANAVASAEVICNFWYR